MQDLSLSMQAHYLRYHGFTRPRAGGILVPALRIELTTPAIQGVFVTIGPPGESVHMFFVRGPAYIKGKSGSGKTEKQ